MCIAQRARLWRLPSARSFLGARRRHVGRVHEHVWRRALHSSADRLDAADHLMTEGVVCTRLCDELRWHRSGVTPVLSSSSTTDHTAARLAVCRHILRAARPTGQPLSSVRRSEAHCAASAITARDGPASRPARAQQHGQAGGRCRLQKPGQGELCTQRVCCQLSWKRPRGRWLQCAERRGRSAMGRCADEAGRPQPCGECPGRALPRAWRRTA